jgi:membrane-associated phospholipid phosphatase
VNSSLKVLGAYAGLGLLLAGGRLVRGDGSLLTMAAYAVIVMAVALSGRARRREVVMLRDWLPLLSLPVLYAVIPTTALGVGPFDPAIQGFDRAIFGGDVAHSFAGAIPSHMLSELLHGAYLSYYLIIYVPPFLMYARDGATVEFRRTVLTFTLAMTACFVVFWIFPVVGPRYLWSAPPGVPDGMFRRLAVALLQGGSAKGTAFPSSHMAIALSMSLSSLAWSRRAGALLLVLTVLLGLGAVYGGFHYATDMAAGALVGGCSWWVAGRIRRLESLKAAAA